MIGMFFIRKDLLQGKSRRKSRGTWKKVKWALGFAALLPEPPFYHRSTSCLLPNFGWISTDREIAQVEGTRVVCLIMLILGHDFKVSSHRVSKFLSLSWSENFEGRWTRSGVLKWCTRITLIAVVTRSSGISFIKGWTGAIWIKIDRQCRGCVSKGIDIFLSDTAITSKCLSIAFHISKICWTSRFLIIGRSPEIRRCLAKPRRRQIICRYKASQKRAKFGNSLP
jgi:hypothetical protein